MDRIRGAGERRGYRAAPRWRRWAPAVAVLAVAGALAIGNGARAERTAAATAPTLEDLLRQRESLQPRESAPAAPARDRLRLRYEELRTRRADIADYLPPALRTPQPRRPELRDPPRELAGREPAADVDADIANPDRVAFEVEP